jgi:hypothetical protein
MRRSWATPFVESFEKAFSEIKNDYQNDPFIYLNKWDVVSDLYSRMKDLFEVMEVETGRFTIGKDGRWRSKRYRTGRISTTPIHTAIGMEKGDKAKADICYIDLESMQFAVTARFSKKKPTSISSWRFSSGAAVSVVKNSEVQYAKRKNNATGRFAKTDGMKELEREILREIQNLGLWDKSVLLLVDDHSLFTKNELEATFSKKLNPYTMKLFYLSPKSGYYIAGKRRSGESE